MKVLLSILSPKLVTETPFHVPTFDRIGFPGFAKAVPRRGSLAMYLP